MKQTIRIPPKSYFQKAEKILRGKKIDVENKNYDFNRIRKACFNSEELKNLLASIGIQKTYEISAGTSDRKAYRGYVDQIAADIKKGRYYRDYTTANGSLEARKSLAFLESLKLDNEKYEPGDICLTNGSTGAITAVFEYLKKTNPGSEVLIATPNYYVYKLAAQYFDLDFKEVLPPIDALIKNISENTKLIIITNPVNPSGEIYSYDDLRKLLLIAKTKNILILSDELFYELVFDPEDYTPLDKIASEFDAMNNLVIVKGYSKTKNLAGFRIGYLVSKNQDLLDSVFKITEQRSCFPTASNFAGLIALDSFIQSADWRIKKRRKNTLEIMKKLRQEFAFSQTIQEKSIDELAKTYLGYQKYLQRILKFYSKMFDEVQETLKKEIIITMPKQSAFNTFVKIKNLEDVNFFDFLLNLYLTTGIKIEIGPGFGLDQKAWEKNPKLGFWLRITFARNKKQFIQGLKLFIEFKKLYLKNQNKFLKTGLTF